MLNENAQDYWKSLFSYENFNGTTSIYSFWNDMNEPSVFTTNSEKTFPSHCYHTKSDGTVVKNRDIINAYGAMIQRATYQGSLERNSNELRPFVLTRSFFIGSQKFGTYWTGDNAV